MHMAVLYEQNPINNGEQQRAKDKCVAYYMYYGAASGVIDTHPGPQ